MFRGLFKTRIKESMQPIEAMEDLGVEHKPHLDFDTTINEIVSMSPRAQSTFLYRLVQKLPFKVLLSLRDYVLDKLSKPKQYAKNTEHRQKENNSVRETTGDTNWR